MNELRQTCKREGSFFHWVFPTFFINVKDILNRRKSQWFLWCKEIRSSSNFEFLIFLCLHLPKIIIFDISWESWLKSITYVFQQNFWRLILSHRILKYSATNLNYIKESVVGNLTWIIIMWKSFLVFRQTCTRS